MKYALALSAVVIGLALSGCSGGDSTSSGSLGSGSSGSGTSGRDTSNPADSPNTSFDSQGKPIVDNNGVAVVVDNTTVIDEEQRRLADGFWVRPVVVGAEEFNQVIEIYDTDITYYNDAGVQSVTGTQCWDVKQGQFNADGYTLGDVRADLQIKRLTFAAADDNGMNIFYDFVTDRVTGEQQREFVAYQGDTRTSGLLVDLDLPMMSNCE